METTTLEKILLDYEINQFLSYESGLLDHVQFDEWFNLMTEDIIYRIPVITTRYRKNGSGISETALHEDDDYYLLNKRVRRLKSDSAWSNNPPNRTRRFITNVKIKNGVQENENEVTSNLLLYRSRGDTTDSDIFSCERQDVLRKVDGGWRIAKRIVIPDQSILSLHNLGIFL